MNELGAFAMSVRSISRLWLATLVLFAVAIAGSSGCTGPAESGGGSPSAPITDENSTNS